VRQVLYFQEFIMRCRSTKYKKKSS